MKETQLNATQTFLLFGVVVTASAVITGLIIRKIATKKYVNPYFPNMSPSEMHTLLNK